VIGQNVVPFLPMSPSMCGMAMVETLERSYLPYRCSRCRRGNLCLEAHREPYKRTVFAFRCLQCGRCEGGRDGYWPREFLLELGVSAGQLNRVERGAIIPLWHGP